MAWPRSRKITIGSIAIGAGIAMAAGHAAGVFEMGDFSDLGGSVWSDDEKLRAGLILDLAIGLFGLFHLVSGLQMPTRNDNGGT